MCAALAAESYPRRSLHQAPSFTCQQAQQLQGRCEQLITCVLDDPATPASAKTPGTRTVATNVCNG